MQLALEAVGGSFAGTKVAVLGAALAPNSDDVRDSPALNVAGQVHLKGAHVTDRQLRLITIAQSAALLGWTTATYPWTGRHKEIATR